MRGQCFLRHSRWWLGAIPSFEATLSLGFARDSAFLSFREHFLSSPPLYSCTDMFAYWVGFFFWFEKVQALVLCFNVSSLSRFRLFRWRWNRPTLSPKPDSILITGEDWPPFADTAPFSIVATGSCSTGPLVCASSYCLLFPSPSTAHLSPSHTPNCRLWLRYIIGYNA